MLVGNLMFAGECVCVCVFMCVCMRVCALLSVCVPLCIAVQVWVSLPFLIYFYFQYSNRTHGPVHVVCSLERCPSTAKAEVKKHIFCINRKQKRPEF